MHDLYLAHYGILGQKWGVRRYQNEDGSWTPAGRERYGKNYRKAVDVANDIYNTLDTYDYGCIINGKRYNENNLDEVDWSKYRTTPVEDFEKTKIGVCWDFTNYQHKKLKEAGINHQTRMIVMDTDDGVVTHTFTTFQDQNGKNYWLEQALYSKRGVHPIDSYKDVVDSITESYDSSKSKPYDVYEFNPDGMDKGLSDQEFFDRATESDPVLQRKDSVEHSDLYLKHYGVKGMKWGVRRYQNADGSLTEEGVYHYRKLNAAKTKESVDRIYNSMSREDKRLLGDDDGAKEFLTYEEGEYVVKRFLDKDGDTPVAFLDIMTTTREGHLTVAIGTDPKYRGQGRAQKLAQKGVNWFDKNADRLNATYLGWGAYSENTGSRRIAENVGFEYEPEKSTEEWSVYGHKLKK